MPHRLVQQHPRPPRPKHYFHLARRSLHRIKLQESPSAPPPAQSAPDSSPPRKKSSITRPPPPEVPREVFAPSFAITNTFSRAKGCVSLANVPSEAATRIRRNSSLIPVRTCVIRGSYVRAASSARIISFSFAAISVSDSAPATAYSDSASGCCRNPSSTPSPDRSQSKPPSAPPSAASPPKDRRYTHTPSAHPKEPESHTQH